MPRREECFESGVLGLDFAYFFFVKPTQGIHTLIILCQRLCLDRFLLSIELRIKLSSYFFLLYIYNMV